MRRKGENCHSQPLGSVDGGRGGCEGIKLNFNEIKVTGSLVFHPNFTSLGIACNCFFLLKQSISMKLTSLPHSPWVFLKWCHFSLSLSLSLSLYSALSFPHVCSFISIALVPAFAVSALSTLSCDRFCLFFLSHPITTRKEKQHERRSTN